MHVKKQRILNLMLKFIDRIHQKKEKKIETKLPWIQNVDSSLGMFSRAFDLYNKRYVVSVYNRCQINFNAMSFLISSCSFLYYYFGYRTNNSMRLLVNAIKGNNESASLIPYNLQADIASSIWNRLQNHNIAYNNEGIPKRIFVNIHVDRR